DRDVVELVNLQRQTLYSEADIDMPKAEAAARRLRSVNAAVQVEAVPRDVHSGTVREWTSRGTASTWTAAFTLRRRLAAASAFGMSMSASEYRVCRWRFTSSTTSRSTRRTRPTPARTSKSEETLPRAPRPTTATWDAPRARWPFAPI